MFKFVFKLTFFLSVYRLCYVEAAEKRFEAEVGHLLDIVINSLYSTRDIFLRELISNASDALEKLKLGNDNLLPYEGKIYIGIDEAKKIVYVEDNGIGMSPEELESNLGTVALSGTKQFADALKTAGDDGDMIGHFGLGFYSSFLVSGKVTVHSIRYNVDSQPTEEYVWESKMQGTFQVFPSPKRELTSSSKHGTKVILHLNEVGMEYLDIDKLKQIALKHSQFINWTMYTRKNDEKLQKLVNETKAIWLRDPKDITEQEYRNFYLKEFKGGDYTLKIHIHTEKPVPLKALLFIPWASHMHFDESSAMEKTNKIKLFVKRVLISENFENFLPKYLHFVTGVLDTSSLPLNVSRQSLIELDTSKKISQFLVEKIFEAVENRMKEDDLGVEGMIKDPNITYEDTEGFRITSFTQTFFAMHGESLMGHCIADIKLATKMFNMLRVPCTKAKGLRIPMSKYFELLPPMMDKVIYMISTENEESNWTHPLVKAAMARDVPVLLMTFPLEETCLNIAIPAAGHRGLSLDHANFDKIDKIDVKARDKLAEKFSKLKNYIVTDFGRPHGITSVWLSTRLKGEPVYSMPENPSSSSLMNKLTKLTRRGKEVYFQVDAVILELNITNPLIIKINDLFLKEGPTEVLKKMLEFIYFSGRVLAGMDLSNSPVYVSNMMKLINRVDDLHAVDTPVQNYTMEEAMQIIDSYTETEKEEL